MTRQTIKITDAQKEYIIALMRNRPVTRAELAVLLGTTNDAATRSWLAREVKTLYPVICTTRNKGYFIPTTPEHLEMAKQASRENHRKAATLHEHTNVLDHWIISTECHLANINQQTIQFNQ